MIKIAIEQVGLRIIFHTTEWLMKDKDDHVRAERINPDPWSLEELNQALKATYPKVNFPKNTVIMACDLFNLKGVRVIEISGFLVTLELWGPAFDSATVINQAIAAMQRYPELKGAEVILPK